MLLIDVHAFKPSGEHTCRVGARAEEAAACGRRRPTHQCPPLAEEDRVSSKTVVETWRKHQVYSPGELTCRSRAQGASSLKPCRARQSLLRPHSPLPSHTPAEDLDFQIRILERSGLDPNGTYLPPAINPKVC